MGSDHRAFAGAVAGRHGPRRRRPAGGGVAGRDRARLHTAGRGAGTALPDPGDWFRALFELEPWAGCPPAVRHDLRAAAALARDLPASTPAPEALHGDLHHDTILHGPRGWCAIDPWGVRGDPACDFASAFRTPVGAGALTRCPARMRALLTAISGRTGLDRRRLAGWAAAHCALSIAWEADATEAVSAQGALLSGLLACARDATAAP